MIVPVSKWRLHKPHGLTPPEAAYVKLIVGNEEKNETLSSSKLKNCSYGVCTPL